MKTLGGRRLRDIHLCFKYNSQFKEAIPVVGMENISELEQDLKFIDSKEPLDSKDLKKINEIKTELGTRFCRGCGYCMPCPQGIDIIKVNLIELSYRHVTIDKFLNPEKTKLLNKTNDCNECGKCEEKCPYDLDIIDMLKENRDFYFKKFDKN